MENKHTSYGLAQMQSLPLKYKISMTRDRIKGWYENFDGNVYVSISGGKDSQVLAHIVKNMYPDVPLVFINTGLEWDCVRKKGEELADTILRPEMNFLEVITKYGYPVISKEVSQDVYEARLYGSRHNMDPRETPVYHRKFDPDSEASQKYKGYCFSRYDYLFDAPFRISHWCCNVMKKTPAKKFEKETNFKPFIGTMAEEGRIRKTKWLKFGCNAFDQKRPTSQPLSFWTEQDILQYIKEYGLDIANVYGDISVCNKKGKEQLYLTGRDRTGCVFCMFGIVHNQDTFIKLKNIEPIKYEYVMRGGKFDECGMWVPAPDEKGKMGLGYKFVIDWLNEHGDLDIKY